MVMLVALAGLAGLGWWLDARVMPGQVWGVLDPSARKVTVMAEGWETVRHAWPVALGGGLVGGALAALALGLLLLVAESADHDAKVAGLNRDLEKAHKATENARGKAEADLAWKTHRVEEKAAEIASREADLNYRAADLDWRLREIQTAAAGQVEAALRERDAARAQAVEAEHRRRNAAAMAERLKRQRICALADGPKSALFTGSAKPETSGTHPAQKGENGPAPPKAGRYG